MGVQRYQDYNTAENKFLVYFADKVLHLECYRYERSGATQYQLQVRKFRHLIDNFKQHPAVQSIQASQYHQAQPNYVLQQNPIYSSCYRTPLKNFMHWDWVRECLKSRLSSKKAHSV